MSDKPVDRVRSRRKFMLDAAAATGGAVVAAVSGTASAEEAPISSPGKAPRGYRETEHIRRYYDKARI